MPPVEVVAVRYEATALMAAKRWNRMVVDFTELRSLTELELFVFARGLSSDLPQMARVALVVRQEQARYAKFVEKIVRNDGVFLTFFFDAEQATVWVKGMTLHERIQHYQPQPAGKHL